MANPSNVLIVDDAAQQKLVSYIRSAINLRDEGWQNRTRFEAIDRAYMRETDRTEEQRKAKLANAAGNINKLQNIQVPMVMETVENAVSFLTNVFLLDYPIFKFGSGPEEQDLALMWNTLVGEDQVKYGWVAQFNIAFRNGAKYNFAPMEVDWKQDIIYKPTNGTGVRGVTLEEVIWEGNCIEALDPYNTIYDSRVPIHKVHEEGEFVGYVKRMTRIQLKRFLFNLGDLRIKNDKKAFEAGEWDVEYYVPHINFDCIIKDKNYGSGQFNWINWVTNTAQNHIKYQNMYTVVVLYARVMPFEFGIRAPKDQTPDIWKLICVNGIMVYAQPIVNAHNYLPIVIAQPLVDNLDHQTKTLSENQVPFQEMVNSLWNAKLASARRRTVDRMLYNPLLVDPDHINSPNPGAKIPLRPTAYGRKLEEAVYQIPFRDDNSQFFVQEAAGVAEWGLRANGQNRVSVGQFQKGNKLQDEFQTTMANAGSRERSQAIMWESLAIQPIKVMLRSNYLQFTREGTRYNRKEETIVDISPQELRKAAGDFDIGDGLLPIQKLVHTDVMQGAFNTLNNVPRIANSYHVGPMFSYMMKVQGVDKLSKFEKTPEEMQYETALTAWQTVAMEVIKKKPEAKPEEIQAIIGPMPQPPQPKGAQNAPAKTR